MSVRVPYVRLVGGWEVDLCDAVDDRFLRLASWRRPGIPDSESHKDKHSKSACDETNSSHPIIRISSKIRHDFDEHLKTPARQDMDQDLQLTVVGEVQRVMPLNLPITCFDESRSCLTTLAPSFGGALKDHSI